MAGCWGCLRGRSCHGWSSATGQRVTLHSKCAPSVSLPPCRKQSVAVGIHSQWGINTWGAGSSALASAPLTPLGKSHSLKCELKVYYVGILHSTQRYLNTLNIFLEEAVKHKHSSVSRSFDITLEAPAQAGQAPHAPFSPCPACDVDPVPPSIMFGHT